MRDLERPLPHICLPEPAPPVARQDAFTCRKCGAIGVTCHKLTWYRQILVMFEHFGPELGKTNLHHLVLDVYWDVCTPRLKSAKLQDNLDGKLSRLLRDKVLKKSGRGRHSVLSLKSEFRPFYERQAEASEAKTESPREEPDAFESDSEGIIQLPDAYDTLFRDETGDGSAALSTLDVYRLHKRIDYLFKEIHLISQCDAIDFLSRLSVSTRVAENVIHSLAMTIFVKAGKTLLGLIAGEKKQKDSSLNETTRVLQGAFRETIQSGLHLFVLLLGFFKPIGEQDQTMMLRFESLLEEYCHVTVELATRGITMRLAPPHPDIADNVQRELPQLWTRLKDAYEGAPQLDGSMKADIDNDRYALCVTPIIVTSRNIVWKEGEAVVFPHDYAHAPPS